MHEKTEPRWLRIHYVLIALCVGLLGVTEHYQFFYQAHPHWQLFLNETAIAGIIAAILALTVDRYTDRLETVPNRKA
jgi:hypothetical protein